MIDFKKFELNAEINSAMKNIYPKKEAVEIFSAICNGKDITKYGDKVDKVMAYMKHIGQKAVDGDVQAKAEINAIRTMMIEAPLVKRLSLFDFMGEKIQVGYDEEVRYKVYQLQGKKSGEQANSGSFPFATANWRTEVMTEFTTITGGFVVDYREVATGNTDAIAVANEQVVTDMLNQMFYKIMVAYHTGIQNATINNYSEGAGITKIALDNVLKKARRFGNLTITGDYSVIEQLSDFAGFTTTTNTVMFSEAVMEEIRKSGLLKFYKGFPVVEIPNTYNVTKFNNTKEFFETYLPEGLLLIVPSGATSPLKIGIKGGLTSMSGTDISLRAEVTRFDMEFGTKLIKEQAYQIGLFSDTRYEVNKY
ncbi:MAG TPA: hypothetical protein PK924_05320 [Bacilli bacterium]|nr:hypothetical protein [Bacilli bacterium]